MAHTFAARRLCGFAALARRCGAAVSAPPAVARAAAGPLHARALTWHAASCAGPSRAPRAASAAGAQARSRHIAAAGDGEPSEPLVSDCCPGCGVHLQSADPDAPGCAPCGRARAITPAQLSGAARSLRRFYQVPKRITEPKEEPAEASDELPFTLSTEEEAAQARCTAKCSRRSGALTRLARARRLRLRAARLRSWRRWTRCLRKSARRRCALRRAALRPPAWSDARLCATTSAARLCAHARALRGAQGGLRALLRARALRVRPSPPGARRSRSRRALPHQPRQERDGGGAASSL